jgi:hypothetical protein
MRSERPDHWCGSSGTLIPRLLNTPKDVKLLPTRQSVWMVLVLI